MCNCYERHVGTRCGGPGCHCHDEVSEFVRDREELKRDIASVLNRHSAENPSGTPDFILAEYLVTQLENFEATVATRADWRGESVELPALIVE